jgi:hypothetical protein
MAASDTFESFINQLSAADRERLSEFIMEHQAMLFAARSEDARTRIVHEFIRSVRDLPIKK